MNVKELIKVLSEFPSDIPVVIYDNNAGDWWEIQGMRVNYIRNVYKHGTEWASWYSYSPGFPGQKMELVLEIG